MIRNTEEYKIRKIPDNFENGINFAGFNFKPLFLIEGIVLGIICFAITIYLFYIFSPSGISSSVIGVSLVPSVLAVILGIRGINDEPLTTFLKNLRYFNSHKRVAYYNPRVKTEIKSIGSSDSADKSVLPRDKIIALFTRYKKAINDKNIQMLEEIKNDNQFKKESMYFEDDIGIVDKPIEYMSKKEYKQHKIKIKRYKQLRKERVSES